MKAPPPPKPVRGWASAYFAGWGTHTENGKTTLTMSVAIDDNRKIQRIILPNIDPKSGKLDPGKPVKELAKTLKIGDAIGFNYLMYDKRFYAAGLTLEKTAGAKKQPPAFTYIGKKLVRSGKDKAMFVTANAGVIPCTFRVPEEIDENGKSRPLKKVTDALKTFCRSDLVELEYKTVNFQFVLTGVKPAVKSGKGTLTKITERKIKGYKHLVALIKTAKRTMTLTDPEAVIKLKLKNVPNPAPDPQVQTVLPTLKPGDKVTFKYGRHRAAYWLKEIHLVGSPTTKPAGAAAEAK